MKKDKLYAILGLACLAGYLYLIVYLFLLSDGSGMGICVFKRITGIPCPSCGSTRAVTALLQGDVTGSLMLNPIGIIVAIILAVLPFWLLFDVIQKKQSLYFFYQRFESFVRKPAVAALLIFLVAANWIWGICKGV